MKVQATALSDTLALFVTTTTHDDTADEQMVERTMVLVMKDTQCIADMYMSPALVLLQNLMYMVQMLHCSYACFGR